MVKFKVTCSIADISTFKMCCTWEKREVASFSALFINSFPSMKSLYSKKGAEQDPTRTKCLQWITLNLLIHCHLPLILHSPHLSSLQSMHEELEMHVPGQDVAPRQGTSENSAFPSMSHGMDTAKHRPCFGEDTGQAVTVLGITCTWGMCGTQRDKLKGKGGLNKAQFPEIWAEKAVSHWRSTSTRTLLPMIDNCIQGLRLVIKTHRQFPRRLSNKKGLTKKKKKRK